jgi:hypothetical protein
MINDETGKIIPFPTTRIQVTNNLSDVDKALIQSLGRVVAESVEMKQNQSTRNIELNEEDMLCLNNEKHFKARFGFVLGKRGRLAVLDLVDQYDLTNNEVKSLDQIGAFSWDGVKLTVKLRKWVGVIGFIALVIPIIYTAILIWAIVSVPHEDWQQKLALYVFLGVRSQLIVNFFNK